MYLKLVTDTHESSSYQVFPLHLWRNEEWIFYLYKGQKLVPFTG
jgi:hypothetical protein